MKTTLGFYTFHITKLVLIAVFTYAITTLIISAVVTPHGTESDSDTPAHSIRA